MTRLNTGDQGFPSIEISSVFDPKGSIIIHHNNGKYIVTTTIIVIIVTIINSNHDILKIRMARIIHDIFYSQNRSIDRLILDNNDQICMQI